MHMYKMRKPIIVAMFAVCLSIALASQSLATQTFDVAGKPLYVSGYFNQGVQFGISGDKWDTQSGFQQGLTQFLLETKYVPSDHTTFFVSGNLNVDWAYEINKDNTEWQRKRFDESRSTMMWLNDFETMLKEAHVTYSTGDFVFRFGKQIVVWGETDGVRLMDQINPVDSRRGISDVKFETTIIPIWLVKAEYFPDWMRGGVISDFGAEFIFNPNLQFIPNKTFGPGNERFGIWGLDIPAGPGARLASTHYDLDRPRDGSSQGWEYGARLKAVAFGSTFTLNAFDGLENAAVVQTVGASADTVTDTDGNILLHLNQKGYFPRQKFVGATVATELPWLRASILGGVAPVLRLEGQYVFDRTFTRTEAFMETIEQHDEIRYSAGIDWKVKIPILNPLYAFSVYAQFVQEHIKGYPNEGTGFVMSQHLYEPGTIQVSQDNYTTSLTLTTQYYHGKILPTFYWMKQFKGSDTGDMYIAKLAYKPTEQYQYSVQGTWMQGNLFSTMANKNSVCFVFSYNF